MGYFSQEMLDVEEMLFEGATPEQIAEKLNLSVEQVIQYIEDLEESDRDSYDDSMDGDFDSAMASAGYGMDEDYA